MTSAAGGERNPLITQTQALTINSTPAETLHPHLYAHELRSTLTSAARPPSHSVFEQGVCKVVQTHLARAAQEVERVPVRFLNAERLRPKLTRLHDDGRIEPQLVDAENADPDAVLQGVREQLKLASFGQERPQDRLPPARRLQLDGDARREAAGGANA